MVFWKYTIKRKDTIPQSIFFSYKKTAEKLKKYEQKIYPNAKIKIEKYKLIKGKWIKA